MRTRTTAAVALPAALIVALVVGARPTSAHYERTGLAQALQTVTAAGAPGAVALVRDHGIVRRAATGMSDRNGDIAMSARDHVRIGSVTKTFVATLTLQLVADRQLSLDATVNQILPGLLPYGDQVTVRQLLNHTGGVPDFFPLVAQLYAEQPDAILRHWDPAQLVQLVSGQAPMFSPGQQFSYSNTDYVLLGMIVEKTTSATLPDEIARRILRPLGLRETTFPVDDLLPPAPAARGYLPLPDGSLLDVTRWNPSAVWAAGAMVSTIDDLARFYQALLGGRLLPPAELHQMLTVVDAGGFKYGLGIIEISTPCGAAIGHNGAVFGYATDVFTTIDGQRQVVLATNLFPGDALAAQEALIPSLLCSTPRMTPSNRARPTRDGTDAA